MPGQEELDVMGAGDRQRQAVDAGPALVAAVVGDRLGAADRRAEVGQLARRQVTGVAAVADRLGRLGRRRRRGGHGPILRAVRAAVQAGPTVAVCVCCAT